MKASIGELAMMVARREARQFDVEDGDMGSRAGATRGAEAVGGSGYKQ